MKKFFKIMGIITGALFVCGSFFLIIGVLSGGLNHTYKNNKWFDIVINPTVEKLEYSRLDDFDSMRLDISTANINIKRGEEFAVEYALYGNIKCEVENDILVIEENNNFRYIELSFKMEETYINIYIPENAVIDIEEINADMGNINISDCCFGEINIEADMGNVEIKNVSVSDFNISAGMGNIEFDGEITGSIQVESDMGNVLFDGNFACDANIDSDMGNVEIKNIYDMQMFDCAIDIDLGKQKINQNKGEIIENKKFDWSIDCDTGDVELTFGKK